MSPGSIFGWECRPARSRRGIWPAFVDVEEPEPSIRTLRCIAAAALAAVLVLFLREGPVITVDVEEAAARARAEGGEAAARARAEGGEAAARARAEGGEAAAGG